MSADRSDGTRTVLVVAGVALVIFGVLALVERTGLVAALIPSWIRLNWNEMRAGLGLIVLGGLVIWLARGKVRMPGAGTRLYRTRDDKWVAGVLGGLARYFGIDATLLRLLFIAFAVLGEGWVIFPYILMAILVPKEPAGAATPSAAPPIEIQVPPAPAAAPAPPVPPSPEPPAAEAAPAAAPAPETPGEPPASES